MRDIIRLALTLAVVGIVSAVLLTGVNSWTKPIIETNRQQRYLENVQSYFPKVAEFKTEEFEGDSFDLIYDSSGNLLGIVGTISQDGYGDAPIIYNLAVDKDGRIIGISILSHAETPGIGDVINQDAFKNQFIGKDYQDPLEADTTTGATISTMAMINSIRHNVAVIAFNLLDMEEEIFDFSGVPDGTYVGSGAGLMDDIVVEVTVAGGKITEIKVLEHDETDTYFIMAYPEIPDRIIDGQKLEVDTRTGATASGIGIVQAVQDALEKALAGGGEDDE